jgi:signal transduction histidine kinase
MRPFSREAGQYAALLILLLGIAGIAVRQSLDYVATRIEGEDFVVISSFIYAITLGYMLIAGAFGLWAVKFASEAEGRRRVGRLIEAMDYMRDGLLTIDRKGRISGSNPAVKDIAGQDIQPLKPLREVFACLIEDDLKSLLSTREPFEVERRYVRKDRVQTLRFRSQPSEGIVLIFVSDVSLMETKRLYARQVAQLQLIGQIARGVANDFNGILSAISGHASLLPRLPPDSPDAQASIQSITRAADRGAALASHLLHLAMPNTAAPHPSMGGQYVVSAIEDLRNSLPDGWEFEVDLTSFPPVSLSAVKIEQVVLNLGLLAADSLDAPGVLRIIGAPPDRSNPLFSVGYQYAGVLLVTAGELTGAVMTETPRDQEDRTGVIISVLRSIIEQANGTLESLCSVQGTPIFRIALPRQSISGDISAEEEFGTELAPYVADWSILIATPAGANHPVTARLSELGAEVDLCNSFVSALARLEENEMPNGIIIDSRIIMDETRGLLRALLKLCPGSAVVVLCDEPESQSQQLEVDIVFLSHRVSTDRILFGLVEARGLSVRRTSVA